MKSSHMHMHGPGMDSDPGEMVKECDICQRSSSKPPQSLLLPWEFP